jgi:hypothetical protein
VTSVRFRSRAAAFLAAGILLGAAVPASAYFRDTHYDLTYALARATCFDAAEARWVASADWMVDQNGPTTAEASPFARDGKRLWHAFGHSLPRYSELWTRVGAAAPGRPRLVALGQFLHFQQDWESHAGFRSRFGHALATLLGADPDSLGLDEEADRRMVQGTVAGLCRACAMLQRLEASEPAFDSRVAEVLGEVETDGLVDDLYRGSDPRWRERLLGGTSRIAREVLARNRRRIEAFLGGEALPAPVALGFSRSGAIADRGPNRHMRRWARMLPDETFPPAKPARLALAVVSAERQNRGWEVVVSAKNRGDLTFEGGSVEAVVTETSSGRKIGEGTSSIGAVRAGRGCRIRVSVPGPPIVSGAVSVAVRGPIASDEVDPPGWLEAEPETRPSDIAAAANPAASAAGETGARLWSDGRVLGLSVSRPARSRDPEGLGQSLEIAVDANGRARRFAIEHPVWSLIPPLGSGPPQVRTFAEIPLRSLCGTDALRAKPSIEFRLAETSGPGPWRRMEASPDLALAPICYSPWPQAIAWRLDGPSASSTSPTRASSR